MSSTGSSLRTPIAKVKGLGPAKAGTHHFWVQRLTSLALVPLTFAFVAIVIAGVGKTHAEAVALLSNPFVAVVLLLFILTSAYHMMLGMQVIIEDYVHSQAFKLTAVIGNIFFSILIGALAVFALLKLAL